MRSKDGFGRSARRGSPAAPCSAPALPAPSTAVRKKERRPGFRGRLCATPSATSASESTSWNNGTRRCGASPAAAMTSVTKSLFGDPPKPGAGRIERVRWVRRFYLRPLPLSVIFSRRVRPRQACPHARTSVPWLLLLFRGRSHRAPRRALLLVQCARRRAAVPQLAGYSTGAVLAFGSGRLRRPSAAAHSIVRRNVSATGVYRRPSSRVASEPS